jgi:hypothetical protein
MRRFTLRQLARALNWKVVRHRGGENAGPDGYTWTIKQEGIAWTGMNTADARNFLETFVIAAWRIGRKSDEIIAMLDDPNHPHHEDAKQWVEQPPGHDDAFRKAFPYLRRRPRPSTPVVWTQAELARIEPDFCRAGVLRSAVQRKLAVRSSMGLIAEMAFASPAPRQRPRL